MAKIRTMSRTKLLGLVLVAALLGGLGAAQLARDCPGLAFGVRPRALTAAPGPRVAMTA